jgi:hypothetical protein
MTERQKRTKGRLPDFVEARTLPKTQEKHYGRAREPSVALELGALDFAKVVE